MASSLFGTVRLGAFAAFMFKAARGEPGGYCLKFESRLG
jgi:hypothetical protein